VSKQDEHHEKGGREGDAGVSPGGAVVWGEIIMKGTSHFNIWSVYQGGRYIC